MATVKVCVVTKRGSDSGADQSKASHCTAVVCVDRRCPYDRSCLIARVVAATVLSRAVAIAGAIAGSVASPPVVVQSR